MYINSQNNLYFGDCAQGDRAATTEEIASWEAARTSNAIKDQIASLEQSQLMPRATREFMLMFMEANATPEILAANFGYQAVKAFDLQIKALRDQL